MAVTPSAWTTAWPDAVDVNDSLFVDSPGWQDNATNSAPPPAGTVATPLRHIGLTTEVVLTVCYAVGIAGNLAALVILVRGGRRAHRNGRHSLMLRCLACNDLVALLGMLVMMEAQLRLPRELVRSRWFCSLRVVWRLFGLGSGSVALVMALERWLALTRPFFYQKHVTCHVVRRAIFSMWTAVLLLVLLPLFGFGLYYDPVSCTCARYPRATKPADIAYAYVYFTFGMLLIACILCCNLLVVRRLHQAGHSSWGRVGRVHSRSASTSTACCSEHRDQQRRDARGLLRTLYTPVRSKKTVKIAPGHQAGDGQPTKREIVRRFSRTCSRSRGARGALQHSESLDSATHEETAFAKLMGFLCVLFVLCWLPQMISIPLTQLWPSWTPGQRFVRLADISLLLHFTLDPFVYVLQRCTRRKHKRAVPVPAIPLLQDPSHSHGAAPDPHQLQAQSFIEKLGAFLRLCSCRRRCRGGAAATADPIRNSQSHITPNHSAL